MGRCSRMTFAATRRSRRPRAPLPVRVVLAAITAFSLVLPACTHGQTRVVEPTASALWYPPGRNQELELTWALSPTLSESDGGPRRNLEIIARIGDAVHRVTLGPHDGVLLPFEQSACNPSLKNATEVSLIRLETMGPETIVARRVRPTLLEISFTVEADDEPAKTHGTLGTIPIPADARVVDAISEIVDGGEERPIECPSALGRGRGPQ
jgi:hypothetical protein